MSLITWSQSLSVGVKQCDEQHKVLIGLINDLHAAMKAGEGNTVLGDIFVSMVEYTKTHFSAEEKLLQEHAYTDLGDQRKSHELFIEDVEKHYEDFLAGRMVTLTVMAFLKGWLEHHIQVDDKKYGPFLNSKGVN